jgi:L-ascorbate metabolism protein UlaG (beta-lactamase superfamily)
MRIRRLGWAGVEIEEAGARIAIDYIGTLGFFEEFLGEEDHRDELVQLEPGSLDGALITHLHRDHADPAALAAALEDGGTLAGPELVRFVSPAQKFAVIQQEDDLTAQGLKRETLSPGESLQIGPFSATACYSVDGAGTEQVAWLVRAGDESILHCGDTLWHARWWDIALEYGSPDVVCLPANGAEINFPYDNPQFDHLADLTPEQAVDAAYALGAGRLLPIHFTRTYENEQMYKPVQDAEVRLTAAAATRDVELAFPEIGEWIEVSKAAAVA